MPNYNDAVFCKFTHKFYRYVMYREDLKIHLLENYFISNLPRVLWKTYEEVPDDLFHSQYLLDMTEVEKFLFQEKEDYLKELEIPEKLLKKKELLETQLQCMENLEKEVEHIKSWKRAIRRQDKKIQRFIENHKGLAEHQEAYYKKLLAQVKQKFNRNELAEQNNPD